MRSFACHHAVIVLITILALNLVQGWKPLPAIPGLKVKRALGIAGVGLSVGLSGIAPSFAGSSRIVAEIPTSGFVFKDKLKIEAFNDPGLPGVTLFLGDFEKPLTEKISGGDIFDDPTSSTLSCVQTGAITDKQLGSITTSGEGEEIFSESKNLFLKSVKVRRVKDPSTGALIYSSFSSKGDKSNDKNKNRFSASLCVVMPKM